MARVYISESYHVCGCNTYKRYHARGYNTEHFPLNLGSWKKMKMKGVSSREGGTLFSFEVLCFQTFTLALWHGDYLTSYKIHVLSINIHSHRGQKDSYKSACVGRTTGYKENWNGENSITFGFLPLGNKQAPESWDSANATTGVAEEYFYVDKRIPIKKYSWKLT